MDHERHLQLLGEATARGHQLQLCATTLLARALVVPEWKARLLNSTLGQGSTLAVLSELANRADCGELNAQRLAKWVHTAKTANSARNRVIHWPWFAESTGGLVEYVFAKSPTPEPRSEQQLQDDIAAMASAVTEFAELIP